MKTRILFGLIGMVQRKRASAQPLPVKSERLPVHLDCGWARVAAVNL
jgi:hypothetical protein